MKGKTAIVYDWMDSWGGVERLLLVLHEIFPEAPFFTSVHNAENAKWSKSINVTTSFMQKLPGLIIQNRVLSVPFYRIAFETFDFSGFDRVVSVSSSFAKSVIVSPSVRHTLILLTPTRFLWSHNADYGSGFPVPSFILKAMKDWDKTVVLRADKIISISQTVRKRCLNYYGLDSLVLNPPFDIEYWKKIKSQTNQKAVRSNGSKNEKKPFLIVSRLERYKKIDLAVKAFNKNGLLLWIVGTGREDKNLRNIAKGNISFLGKVTDLKLVDIYLRSRALIMPQEEDFGYVSLEAQFFKLPVISYEKGGASETVIENETGIFFPLQTVDSLNQAVERFIRMEYNLKKTVAEKGFSNCRRFDKKKFEAKLKKILL